MKKFVLLFAIGLLLVACGSTSTETAVSVPEEQTKPVADSTEGELAAESETETEAESESSSEATDEIAMSGFPATTVEEASIVRDRDWVKGTDDPLVAIIEYGDFQ